MKRKDFIILLWISLATAFFFFFFFNQEMTLENFAITFLISAMYSFIIGVGNGVINELLNKKFPWSEETKKRAILSIISIVIANFVLVYLCNYINFVIIQKVATTERFFGGDYNHTIGSPCPPYTGCGSIFKYGNIFNNFWINIA